MSRFVAFKKDEGGARTHPEELETHSVDVSEGGDVLAGSQSDELTINLLEEE
jgi:hypothetical protein